LILPLTVGIILLSPDFIRLFLGNKWLAMFPALQILACAGFNRSLVVICLALFRGAGRPEYDFRMNLFRISVMAITIYPLTVLFGIHGTATAILLATTAILPLIFIYTIRIIGSFEGLSVFDILPSFVSTLIMAIIILALRKMFLPLEISDFAGVFAIAITGYIACQLAFWKMFKVGLFADISRIKLQWLSCG
jgi:O-antigen/teichoic acid export membrane protein